MSMSNHNKGSLTKSAHFEPLSASRLIISVEPKFATSTEMSSLSDFRLNRNLRHQPICQILYSFRLIIPVEPDDTL